MRSEKDGIGLLAKLEYIYIYAVTTLVINAKNSQLWQRKM